MDIRRAHILYTVPDTLDCFLVGELIIYSITSHNYEVMVLSNTEGFDFRDSYDNIGITTPLDQFSIYITKSTADW